MEEAVEITVFTALHNAGVAYEDFSPEQMDVIYSVAEAGGELEELLNPDFPPEQMQLIADVQNRTDAISRAAAEEALEPLLPSAHRPVRTNAECTPAVPFGKSDTGLLLQGSCPAN